MGIVMVVYGLGGRDLVRRKDAQTLTAPTDDKATRAVGVHWAAELDQLDPDARDDVMKTELTVPILSEVLGSNLWSGQPIRLTMVVTDQGVGVPQRQADTVTVEPIVRRLLELRGVPGLVTCTEPVVIHQGPHLIDEVISQLNTLEAFDRLARDADAVVAVHGGGPPALKLGVAVALALQSGKPVRMIQVTENHELVDTGLPALVRQATLFEVVRLLLRRDDLTDLSATLSTLDIPPDVVSAIEQLAQVPIGRAAAIVHDPALVGLPAAVQLAAWEALRRATEPDADKTIGAIGQLHARLLAANREGFPHHTLVELVRDARDHSPEFSTELADALIAIGVPIDGLTEGVLHP